MIAALGRAIAGEWPEMLLAVVVLLGLFTVFLEKCLARIGVSY